MKMEKPEVSFIAIDLHSSVLITSDTCENCAKTSGGYRGGGQGCYGDDTVSTECDTPDASDLSDSSASVSSLYDADFVSGMLYD